MATNKNENTALQTMLEPNCKKLTIEIPYEFTEYLSSLKLPACQYTLLAALKIARLLHGIRR